MEKWWVVRRAFEEDWIRPLRIFERLYGTYELVDEDKLEFRRVRLREGSLAFNNESIRAIGISY